MNVSKSPLGVIEAVGLLGLQIYTSDAPLLLADMVSRSCAYLVVSGIDTTSAPTVRAYSDIAGNVGEACTNRVPTLRNANAAARRISVEPQPRITCSGSTRCV